VSCSDREKAKTQQDEMTRQALRNRPIDVAKRNSKDVLVLRTVLLLGLASQK
jgi:hypothetical protein